LQIDSINQEKDSQLKLYKDVNDELKIQMNELENSLKILLEEKEKIIEQNNELDNNLRDEKEQLK
jgi:septal ring factor EnvC (AmiA/AmiB activator)